MKALQQNNAVGRTILPYSARTARSNVQAGPGGGRGALQLRLTTFVRRDDRRYRSMSLIPGPARPGYTTAAPCAPGGTANGAVENHPEALRIDRPAHDVERVRPHVLAAHFDVAMPYTRSANTHAPAPSPNSAWRRCWPWSVVAGTPACTTRSPHQHHARDGIAPAAMDREPETPPRSRDQHGTRFDIGANPIRPQPALPDWRRCRRGNRNHGIDRVALMPAAFQCRSPGRRTIQPLHQDRPHSVRASRAFRNTSRASHGVASADPRTFEYPREALEIGERAAKPRCAAAAAFRCSMQ